MAEKAERNPRAQRAVPAKTSKDQQAGAKRKKRRRPRRKAPAPVEVAARAIEAATDQETESANRLPEEPLSREEVAAMKRHLRFLRDHRKVLNLKVNAQEDLLLNDRREPTHRGVCQHLLSKVERKRVLSAAERLEPEAATRLVEGVLRISPDVDYVLLYLDCVRRTGARAQAVAALSEALERIDFEQVSPGQMRRVLDLVVELFDHRQRPQVLLGRLEGRAFRQAFDETARQLPEALASLVVPLRAAQSVAPHGKANRHGAARLREGLRLLLHGDEAALLRYPSTVRQRLLELGTQACGGTDAVATRALLALLESLKGNQHVHGSLGVELARALIAAEEEAAAKKLLGALDRAHPTFELPQRWSDLLDAPRADRIALRASDGDRQPRAGRRQRSRKPRIAPSGSAKRGVLLDGMRPVSLFFEADTAGSVLESVSVAGVAPVVATGVHDGSPYFAVPTHGPPLDVVLERKGGVTREQALRVCAELVGIFASVASAGLTLPDARLSRFEQELGGRVWLVDGTGAERAADTDTMLQRAREACRAVLDSARRFVPPMELPDALATASSFAALSKLVQPR